MNNSKKTIAAALSYTEDSIAPKLVAKGKGLTADEIIALAKENNIPIQEDASLAALLTQLDINQTIPEELYQAVAEIFAFIYQLDQAHPK